MSITRSGRDAPPPPPPTGGPVTMVSEPSLHSSNFPLHLCHQWRPPQQPLPLTTRTPRCQNPQAPPHDRPPTSAPPLFYSAQAAASSFPPHPPATSSPFPQLSPSLLGSSPYARRNPQEKQGVNYPPSVRSDVSLIASSSITHPHRSKEWVDQYLKSLQEKARKQSPPPYYMEYCQEKARRYPTPLQYREYLQEKMEMQPTREVSMSASLPTVDVVEEEENDGEVAIGNNEEDQESEASKQGAEASSSQYFNNHEGHFFPKPMPVVEVSLGEMQSTVSAVLEENVEALVEQHRCINIGSLYAQVKELHPWTDAKFVKEVIDASCFTSILVHSSLARLTIALWGSEEHYSKYTSENGSEMVGIVTDASLAPEKHTLEATPVCKALYSLGVMGNSTCSLLDKLCEDGIVRQWVEIIEGGTIVVIFDPGGGEDEATWTDTGNDLEEDSLSSFQALGIVELEPREPILGLIDTAIKANVENGQIVSGFLKNILMNKNDTGKITIVRLLGGYLPDAIEDTGTTKTIVCSVLQGLVSCPPIASDELNVFSFLGEVKGVLGSPIVYGQDIRVLKSPKERDANKELHYFHDDMVSNFIDGRNVDEFEKAFREGYTIALRGMEFRYDRIASVAKGLANLFGQPSVGANVVGQKRWRISPCKSTLLPRLYEPVSAVPDSKDDACGGLEYLLNEGDILYIPRGIVHEACTFDNFSLHLTLGIEVEAPFEWEGFAHTALHCWNEKKKLASFNIADSRSRNMFVILLHIVIRQIADEDPTFRKACMVAALSSNTLLLKHKTTFNCITEKIDASSSFAEAFKYIRMVVEQENDDSLQWMRWLIFKGGLSKFGTIREGRCSYKWRCKEQKVQVPSHHCDSGVRTICADVMELLKSQARELSPQGKGFSVILSDMSPSVSGITTKDISISCELGHRALSLALGKVNLDGSTDQSEDQDYFEDPEPDADEDGVLRQGGNLVIKLLEGEGNQEFSNF